MEKKLNVWLFIIVAFLSSSASGMEKVQAQIQIQNNLANEGVMLFIPRRGNSVDYALYPLTAGGTADFTAIGLNAERTSGTYVATPQGCRQIHFNQDPQTKKWFVGLYMLLDRNTRIATSNSLNVTVLVDTDGVKLIDRDDK